MTELFFRTYYEAKPVKNSALSGIPTDKYLWASPIGLSHVQAVKEDIPTPVLDGKNADSVAPPSVAKAPESTQEGGRRRRRGRGVIGDTYRKVKDKIGNFVKAVKYSWNAGKDRHSGVRRAMNGVMGKDSGLKGGRSEKTFRTAVMTDADWDRVNRRGQGRKQKGKGLASALLPLGVLATAGGLMATGLNQQKRALGVGKSLLGL